MMSQALANSSIMALWSWKPWCCPGVVVYKINARPWVSAAGMAAAGKCDTSSVNSLVSTTEPRHRQGFTYCSCPYRPKTAFLEYFNANRGIHFNSANSVFNYVWLIFQAWSESLVQSPWDREEATGNLASGLGELWVGAWTYSLR